MKGSLEAILAIVVATTGNEFQEAQEEEAKSTNPYNPAILEANAWSFPEASARGDNPHHRGKESAHNPFPRNIKITGVAEVEGEKRVFFAFLNKKDTQQVHYVSLAKGQTARGIRVLDVRPQAGEVRLQYGKRIWTLNLKDHGYQFVQHENSSAGRGSSSGTAEVTDPIEASERNRLLREGQTFKQDLRKGLETLDSQQRELKLGILQSLENLNGKLEDLDRGDRREVKERLSQLQNSEKEEAARRRRFPKNHPKVENAEGDTEITRLRLRKKLLDLARDK